MISSCLRAFFKTPLLAAALFAPVVFAQSAASTNELFKMLDLDRPTEVRALLLKGVKPDVVDERGDHALLVASRNGLLQGAQTLVDAGAKVNLRNKWGDSALMVAALNGHDKVVRYLRGKGRMDGFALRGGQWPRRSREVFAGSGSQSGCVVADRHQPAHDGSARKQDRSGQGAA
jgi:Ankyrin repeats (3 copies)